MFPMWDLCTTTNPVLQSFSCSLPSRKILARPNALQQGGHMRDNKIVSIVYLPNIKPNSLSDILVFNVILCSINLSQISYLNKKLLFPKLSPYDQVPWCWGMISIWCICHMRKEVEVPIFIEWRLSHFINNNELINTSLVRGKFTSSHNQDKLS